jgi:NitT/TauT family transport system permease protein
LAQAATLDARAGGFAGARLRRILGLVLGWATFLGIWAFTSEVILDPFTLPRPISFPFPEASHGVANAMWDIIESWEFVDDFQASISKTFVGFAVAVAFGVPIGFAMGRSRYWKAFFHDGVVGAGSIPGLTYAVMALVIFGISFQGPVLAVGLISMPYIALNVAEGLEGVDQNLLRMSAAFERSDREMLRHVLVPSILPFVFAGVRLSFALAWKVEALTEVFGSSEGVGFQIRFAFQGFSITRVMAWTLLFIIFMLVIERLLALVEKRLFRWRTWEQQA